MNEDRYTNIRNTSDYQTFAFISEGRYGDLTKIVSFDEVPELYNTFNLALGTLLPDGEIDFETITNNGDRNRVLATVVEIVRKFIEKNPQKRVYITGSDKRRMLLYQRAIIYGYDALIDMFLIYGDTSINSSRKEFEIFEKTKDYSGFIIEKK